jgi:4-phytase/acid phosphatase
MPPWSIKGVMKARYRQLGLLTAGCPAAERFTCAPAPAAHAGHRPGAGGRRLSRLRRAIHYVSGDADPLFQTDKFAATQTDPARQLAAVKKRPAIWRSVGRRWLR